MTPNEFIKLNKKQKLFEDLSVFPIEKVEQISDSKISCEFLTVSGIPRWAAPHFYFGDFEKQYLPLLQEWPWGKISYPSEIKAWVIGADPEENPVCLLKDKDDVVIFKTPSLPKYQLLNSSIPKLIQVLVEYQIMVDNAIREVGENAFQSNSIPERLIEKFKHSLKSIDKQGLFAGTFWEEEIRRLESR